MIKIKKKSNFAILMIALFIIAAITAYGATSDSSDGSFTLNSTPEITDVDFVDAADAPTSTLIPDESTGFGVDVDVSHSAGMSDLHNLTIWIFDDSVYGANYNTSAADGLQLVEITWTESTGAWAIDQGAFTGWTLGSHRDPGVANASTTGDFTARFDISSAARADSDWNCTVHVYDDDATPEAAYAAEDGLVTMSAFYSVSFSVGTFSWGNDVVPDSVNNTHDAVQLTIWANAGWTLAINGTDFTGGAGADIDATLVLVWDEDGAGGGVSMQVTSGAATSAEGTWLSQTAMPDETPLTRNMYILLTDTGSGLFTVGQLYTTTIAVLISA